MPELPEVETVARGLRHLTGNRLRQLQIHDSKVWFESVHEPERLSGMVLREVSRRGKYILLRFEGGFTLVQHLRMTGKMLEAGSSAVPEAVITAVAIGGSKKLQVRCRFHFEGFELWFYDTRRFGTLTLVANEEEYFRKKKIAPDPMHEPERAFEWFRDSLARTSKPAKAALLDQSLVAGVGNIYADEALHGCGIHPRLPANKISDPRGLWKEILRILVRSITLGGTTIGDYVNTEGKEGAFARLLRVYDRKGEPCKRCRTTIVRIVLAGRSTHFCPSCQLQPRGKKRPSQGGSRAGQPRSSARGISAKVAARSRSKRRSPK